MRATMGSSSRLAPPAACASVSDGDSGIQVFGIAGPASPKAVGSADTAGFTRGVAVAGRHEYVADGSSGPLIVARVSGVSPEMVGSPQTPGTPWPVPVLG
jgi:hypothetical protein